MGSANLPAGRFGGKRPVLTLEVGDLGAYDRRPGRSVIRAKMGNGYRSYERRGGRALGDAPHERYGRTDLFRPR